MALIISCFTSMASSILYNRWISLEKSSQELVKRNEELDTKDKSLTDKIDNLNKKDEDLKLKENELNDKESKLNQKEDELIERENKLKIKEEELERKLSEISCGNGSKIIYLTFDDGPSENTSEVLDILAKNNIKATFFVNGHPEYENTYLRIVNEGHKIGNHTYSHDYSQIYTCVNSFNNDIVALNNYLESIGVGAPNIIRFPGGSNNTVSNQYGGANIMAVLTGEAVSNGYGYIDWNVSSGDADKVTNDKDTIVKNVLEGCKNKDKAVVLFHDSKPKTTTVEALPEIIKELKREGYVFGTIDKETSTLFRFM